MDRTRLLGRFRCAMDQSYKSDLSPALKKIAKNHKKPEITGTFYKSIYQTITGTSTVFNNKPYPTSLH